MTTITCLDKEGYLIILNIPTKLKMTKEKMYGNLRLYPRVKSTKISFFFSKRDGRQLYKGYND